jgi:uncharacterized protein
VTNPIFLDTLFVVALVNWSDQYHPQAVDLSERLEGVPLITTDAVLLEIGNALARSYKKEAVEIIDGFLLSDEVEVIHLTPDLFSRAYALYRGYQDKAWGFVDCISFVVMRERNIDQALTLDQYFVQAGYQALMRDEFSRT